MLGTAESNGISGSDGILGSVGIQGAMVSRMSPSCLQATLEKCAKCQGLITERIVRALGKGFHPGCFACAACGRAIGAESFAVDEQGKVYCVADFYRWGSTQRGVQLIPVAPWVSHHCHFIPPRKFAPMCGACKHPIIPDEDTYKIECLGRSFHESCYRCEVWPPNSKCCPSASQSTWGWRQAQSMGWWRGAAVQCPAGSTAQGCKRALHVAALFAELRDAAVTGADGGWVLPAGPPPALQSLPHLPAERVVLLNCQLGDRAVPQGWTHREQRNQRFITRVCWDPIPHSSASSSCSSQAEEALEEQWWWMS